MQLHENKQKPCNFSDFMKIHKNHLILPHEMIINFVILLASRNHEILQHHEKKQKTMKFCHLHENIQKHDDLPTSRKKAKTINICQLYTNKQKT